MRAFCRECLLTNLVPDADNEWGACGSFSGPNGSWVQKYDAQNPKDDPQYALDVLDWTRRFVEACHREGTSKIHPALRSFSAFPTNRFFL